MILKLNHRNAFEAIIIPQFSRMLNIKEDGNGKFEAIIPKISMQKYY